MKKLIATCIILGCLLMPLKGYSENSAEIFVGTAVVAGVVGVITSLVVNFIKATGNEADWANKAWEFHCNNVQQANGQAFAKYQGYLAVIDTFLIKHPFNNNFRNDFKSVFDMSQDDSRLTLSEKQKIVDKFASKKEFPTEPKKLKGSDDWWGKAKKGERGNGEQPNQSKEDLMGDPAVNLSYKS
jgi:hypothetical protein